MTDVRRVALAARVFTIAALTSLAALAGEQHLSSALYVAATTAVAVALSSTRRLSETTVAVLEGTAVATLAVVTYPNDANVTPYLVIPALIGAMDQGARGFLRVVTVEFGSLAVLWVLVIGHWDRALASSGFTWLAAAVGIGFMGAALRRSAHSSAGDSSYRSALGLIRRLEALSGKLSGGLDSVGIAERIMERADAVAVARGAGVFVRSASGSMAPLRYYAGTQPTDMTWAESLSTRCWQSGSTILRERHVAMPIATSEEMIAVVVLDTLQPLESTTAVHLCSELTREAVPLQAALLFGRVRDSAMSQERQRIAREMHDGLAQDVASIGYLVDNLAAISSDPAQRQQIRQLREEVTRVVSELRHSVFDLRHEIAGGAGLGESLSTYAHQVGSTSPMTVHVTLDEKGPRLPADVEYELLRIAQEAMTNARKHSAGANLWLRCTVRAPYAEIEVVDDGTRRHAPKVDSHGLTIIKERSRSIDAELVVSEPTPELPGTRVLVRLGAVGASLLLGGRDQTRMPHDDRVADR